MSTLTLAARRATPRKAWYDHVIVGAGISGSVLASRLAEKGAKVLLLESSSLPDPKSRIPSFLDARLMPQRSGHQATPWARGHAEDYNRWAQLTGEDTWSSENMESHLERAERRIFPFCSTNIGLPQYSEAFLQACEQVTHSERTGLDVGQTASGVGYFQSAFGRDGQKLARDAYLLPTMFASGADGQQLEVMGRTRIHRVLVEGGRATGVEWEGGSVNAGEVVLCAGTLGSPHLLLNSGIGPQAQLQGLGTPVVQDLPGVGANFHGHVGFSLPCSDGARAGLEAHTMQEQGHARSWRDALAGMFSTKGAAQSMAGGYIKSRRSLSRADLQLTLRQRKSGVHLDVCLARPHARGQLGHFEPLADQRDSQALMNGVRHAQEIIEAMECGSQQGSARTKLETDAEILDFLRTSCTLVGPGVGTCAMGAGAASVVDGKLQVHGVTGLRVADASIMPEVVVSDPHGSIIAVAEVAAKLLSASMALCPRSPADSMRASENGLPPTELAAQAAFGVAARA